jgi:Ca2+-binding RTX toxin-like protein
VGATYTRTLIDHADTTGFGIQANNQFDLDGDWARVTAFQRDTFRANGIVDMPYGFSASASYFFGSGAYYNATRSGRPFGKPGTNRLNTGAPIVIPEAMLDRWEGADVIATGDVWAKNALRGLPLHKVDMRVSKRFTFGSQMEITLLAEVFNVFNRKNYGSYNTQLDSANFGQPTASSGNAYVPRSGQLGFRVSF